MVIQLGFEPRTPSLKRGCALPAELLDRPFFKGDAKSRVFCATYPNKLDVFFAKLLFRITHIFYTLHVKHKKNDRIHIRNTRFAMAKTDQMGYVYYGNYALYCEVGRTELLRSLGLNLPPDRRKWLYASGT